MKGQTRDPYMLTAQYLENSWRFYSIQSLITSVGLYHLGRMKGF